MASAPSSASRSAPTATPATSASSQPAVDITAVTTRDDFLLELGQTLDGQAGVRPVDTLDAALESLSDGRRAQLLVLDARAVGNVRAAVDSAATRAPRALVLVFAEAGSEKQTAAALKGSKVFAVLPTPLDARKTQAVFSGAIAEAVAARAAAPAVKVSSGELSIGDFSAPERADAGGATPASGKPKLLLLAAVLAAIAAAGSGYWYFTHANGTPVRAPSAPAAARTATPSAPGTAASSAADELAPQPATDTQLLQGKLDELLEKARAAMHDRRFTEPAGDNALLYYRSAAAADPNSGEARDGLQRIAGVLAQRFDETLTAGHPEEAAQTLANLKAAAPDDSRIPALDLRLYTAEIGKTLADGNLERAAALVRQAQAAADIPAEQLSKWRADIARRTEDAKVSRLATLVDERIRDGKLTDADDSAKSYMAQLLAAAPANPTTLKTQRDLGTTFLRKARDAALAKNSAEEDRWLNEARSAGMKPADILAFQHDLSTARAKAAQVETERQLQAARDRIRDGRLTDPAQDSAVFYLTQLQNADATNTAAIDVGHDLANKLLDRARTSIAAGKSPDADLALAKHWGADPKDLSAVQQLQSAPKGGAAALDPATLSANLKRLRAPPPDYPENALTQHVSGSVTVAFTVDINGEPRDIHVVEATPPGVFDRAAVAAIRHWRYAPTIVNGKAVEVPARTLMRFELPK